MEETAPQLLTGIAEFAARAEQMVGAAHMEVALLSQELDRRVYAGSAFADALRKFVLQHSHTKVRILVNATQNAIVNSPRLVELGRSLSTYVEFRELQPQRRQVVREEVLIVDGRQMLYRESPTDLEAQYFAAPQEARHRLKGFNQLWDESETAQELRKLGI